MSNDYTCRLLTPEDVEQLRTLRLRACKEEPIAFTESYEELADAPKEKFLSHFDKGWVAGAFKGAELVAMAGLYEHYNHKVAHKGSVWGVYVAPEARGAGLARSLITLLLEEAAKTPLEIIHLSTDASNKITVGLYESLGFEAWGIDRDFARVNGTSIDEIMMKKHLKAPRP